MFLIAFGVIAFLFSIWNYCENYDDEKARQARIRQAYSFQPPNVLGGARFANDKDLKKAGLFKRKGIPIGYSLSGRALFFSRPAHALTIGAARSGKGASLIVNALLSWPDWLFGFDPKGENAAITAHFRTRFGKVYIVNPFGIVPEALKGLTDARFNPMDLLDVASASFHADCDKLAAALIWEEAQEGFHFITAARLLVAGVIAALMRHGDAAERNLVAVARVVSGDIYEFCWVTVQSTNDKFITQKLGRFASKNAKESREVQDVVSTAITQLGFIGNEAIARCLSASDFRFSDLKRNPGTSVYICVPLNKLDICAKFNRLLLETLLADLLSEGQRGNCNRVLAIIDEMSSMGPHMKSLANAMGMAAGAAGLQIWGILQDLSQLKGMFPHTWETFIQNCGVTTWFGARDATTREYVSKLSGSREAMVRSRNVTIDLRTAEPIVSDGVSQQSRPLLLPHEVGQIGSHLGDSRMIAFVEGVPCGPVIARRKFYFRVFPRRMYRDNPYVANRVSAVQRLLNWIFG